MHAKTKKKVVAHDLNEWAARVVEATTGVKVPHDIVEQEIRKIAEEKAAGKSEDSQQPPKNAAAVALGRLGGLKGGKARAEALTAKQRAEIAKAAAKARWSRNADIVKLQSKGYTRKEIATKLGVSETVVLKNLEGAKAKLAEQIEGKAYHT